MNNSLYHLRWNLTLFLCRLRWLEMVLQRPSPVPLSSMMPALNHVNINNSLSLIIIIIYWLPFRIDISPTLIISHFKIWTYWVFIVHLLNHQLSFCICEDISVHWESFLIPLVPFSSGLIILLVLIVLFSNIYINRTHCTSLYSLHTFFL